MRQAVAVLLSVVLLVTGSSTHAFAPGSIGSFAADGAVIPPHDSIGGTSPRSSSSSITRLYNTGGWGIGPQRELTPEEFAKGGDRRAFEGYKLRDRGEFMRQVAQDKQDLQKGELDELLAVAQQAGIKVRDPAERLNKFQLEDDDEEEDLDLSVQWDEVAEEEAPAAKRTNDSDSITRLDEDTGASGVW